MIFANPTLSIFIVVAHSDDRMVRLQTEQESGKFAGIVVRKAFDAPGASILESLAQRHVPFILRMAAVAVADRDIGASAVDQQLVRILRRKVSTSCWQWISRPV